jgi:hypothetical protein
MNGGGTKERPIKHRGGKQFYLDILKGRRPIDDLELTCKVCNAWHHLTKLKGIKDGWTITWKK